MLSELVAAVFVFYAGAPRGHLLSELVPIGHTADGGGRRIGRGGAFWKIEIGRDCNRIAEIVGVLGGSSLVRWRWRFVFGHFVVFIFAKMRCDLIGETCSG